jgi:hypothetical protein
MISAPSTDPTLLDDALGTSDPAALLDLVRSMEGQLAALYGSADIPDEAPPAQVPDLAALYAMVGVHTAAEFVDLVRSMEEQLAALYDAPAD